MAYGNIGFSREIPLAGDANGSGGQTSPRGVSPQQAVKIFSLRVPERESQGALAPVSLLTQKRSGAGTALDSLIAELMRTMRPQLTSPAPLLPSQTGTGTYGGWLGQERNLGGQPTTSSDEPGVPYDAGTGFGQIGSRGGGGTGGAPAPGGTVGTELPYVPPRRDYGISIGYQTAPPPETGPENPPSLFDNTAPARPEWYQNKYDSLFSGPDVQTF